MSSKSDIARFQNLKQPSIVVDLLENGGFEVYGDEYVDVFSRRAHSEGEDFEGMATSDIPHGWLCGSDLATIARQNTTADTNKTPCVVLDVDDDDAAEFLIFFDEGVSVIVRSVDQSDKESFVLWPRNPIPNGWLENCFD